MAREKKPRTLVDAVYKAFTGRTPRLEKGPIADRINFLEKKHGSLAAVSRETGVSRSTLRRWRDGQAVPKPDSEQKLTAALRTSLIPGRRRKRIGRSTGRPDFGKAQPTGPGSGATRAARGGISIKATVKVSSDERDRTLNLGQHMDENAGEALLLAFVSGDDEEFTALLHTAVGNYFGSTTGWELLNVAGVSFNPID
jgi:transcriptional regulator with XRE-family HTH domain